MRDDSTENGTERGPIDDREPVDEREQVDERERVAADTRRQNSNR